MSSAGGLADWRIEAGPACEPAAEALRRYLPLTGRGGSAGTITLGIEPAQDADAVVRVEEGAAAICGADAGGVLRGAWWLLEQLGFVAVEPGAGGVGRAAAGEVATGTFALRPRFATRTLILGQDALHDDWRDWLGWAAANGLNSVFFHDTPPSRERPPGTARPADSAGMAAEGGGWLFERWQADGPLIVAEARRYGMSVQFGGHHMSTLLPRALFAEHPEWFPFRGGKRDPRRNLCVSGGALDEIRAAAERFAGRFAGADVYHCWADDIRGGGWCECDGCRELGPAGQALTATNAIAAGIAKTAPGARVAHLAYHDTLTVPEGVEPAGNVTVLWAPRERCYAHPADGAGCERNAAAYRRPLEQLRAATPNSPLQVFEYWSDAILLKGIAAPHLETLPADLRFYAASDAADVQDLVVGDRPWVGPPWHAWWFARLAAAEHDPGAALDLFCRAAYGDVANAMARYYRRQDAACRELLNRMDFEDVARHDVLDFGGGTPELVAAKAKQALDAAEELAACAAGLDGLAAGNVASADRLARECDQARFNAASAANLAHRLAARAAPASGDERRAAGHRAEAERALADMEAWDAAHDVPAYGAIRGSLRRGARHHTGELRGGAP